MNMPHETSLMENQLNLPHETCLMGKLEKKKNIPYETCFMGKHGQTYPLDHQHKMHQMRNSHWCCQLS